MYMKRYVYVHVIGAHASSGRRHLLRDLQYCCGVVLPLKELVHVLCTEVADYMVLQRVPAGGWFFLGPKNRFLNTRPCHEQLKKNENGSKK